MAQSGGENQPQIERQNGMTKRARNALLGAGYIEGQNPAIEALVMFAAQNPGLDARNYYDPHDKQVGRVGTFNDGLRAYRQEAKSINQDWQRFKGALAIAAKEGVTDKDVIEAAPGAFSGRLTWLADYPTGARWDYTTGQYFPTEYRKAAATVIEYATREVKRNREPVKKQEIRTIAELKALNEQNGGCWFAPAEMRFFGTRIEGGILRGRYFISSEQREENTPRRFTVRSFDETGSVDTVGEFHSHDTKQDALDALKAHIEAGEPVTA